jgi:CDP-6-deoxy-D-xylo-4-hexulose-3-dehydrase
MIKLAADTIDTDDFRALSTWLKGEPFLTKGPLVEEFEEQFAAWMGVKFAVMVNSGSSANLLMIQALLCSGQLKKGDKVVLPAVCWATDLAPLMQLGLIPVVCDVNLQNAAVLATDLETIFQKEAPKALLLVSILGMPPAMEEILFLTRKYNVILLEDTCESLGSRSDGFLLGSFGLMSTMSMYFGHHISTIEGGMIFTSDPVLASILKMIRAHGWDRDLSEEEKKLFRDIHEIKDFDARFTFYYPGFNVRPTEINAFLGLRQLKKLENIIVKRKENFEFYQEYVKNNQWKPLIPKEDLVSSLGYPIIHSKRDKIAKALIDAGVECRPFISGNIARQPVFTLNYGYEKLLLPNADRIHDYGMYVPNHPYMGKDEVFFIADIINKVIND